jgi:hypothetical protein
MPPSDTRNRATQQATNLVHLSWSEVRRRYAALPFSDQSYSHSFDRPDNQDKNRQGHNRKVHLPPTPAWCTTASARWVKFLGPATCCTSSSH